VAWAASRTRDTYLRARFERLTRRRGRKKVVVAVGHSILVIIYHRLRTGQDYRDLGTDYFATLDSDRVTQHHVQRLSLLGYEVTLTPREDFRRKEVVRRRGVCRDTWRTLGRGTRRIMSIAAGSAMGPRRW